MQALHKNTIPQIPPLKNVLRNGPLILWTAKKIQHLILTYTLVTVLSAKPGLIGQVLGLIGLEVKEVFCGHVLDYPTDTRAQIAM